MVLNETTTKQLLLGLTMALVALAVGGVAIVLLHGAAIEQAHQNLAHTARAQARLMEAVARFDVQHSARDHPQGATGATLSQIIDSLRHYEGFGATGGIVIGRRDGDRIVVLHYQRRDDSVPQSLPWDGPAGEPLRRALRGEAGTFLGLDARGQEVLAAYEPVAGLGIGVVAKINRAEINAPFVRASLYAGAVALFIIVLGVTLFLRVTNPLIRRLAESEERFRALAGAALEGIMFTDNGRIVEINETGATLAGGTRAALIGRSVLDFCAPADREHVAAQIRDNVTTPYEFTALRVDGSEFPVEVRGCTSTYHGHAVRVTVFRDLTEHRRAVQALRDSEQLLRLVLDTLPVGVWVADKQGKIILGNPEGQRIWAGARYVGVDQYGEYKGWWADTGKPIAADEWALARAIRHGETSLNEVIDIECFDGTRKTILHSAKPIRADGDEITGAIVVIQDITERRHAEQALIQSENNFRALTENANVGILVNHRGRHVFANNKLLTMLGYSAEEFYQTGIKELVHPLEYDKIMERWRARQAGEPVPSIYETVFMTRDRQAVPVELTVAMTTWQGEPAGLAFLHDIRERLRTDEQMRKLSSALEQTADSVVITDRAGVIEYVNLFENTGYGRRGPGQTPGNGQQDGFYKKLWDTILAGEVFSGNVNRRKDGSLYYEEKPFPALGPSRPDHAFVATGKDERAYRPGAPAAHWRSTMRSPSCRTGRLDRLKHAGARLAPAPQAVLFVTDR